MKNKKMLIMAPHWDDEVLGCGGIMAKYSKENEIYVCIATQYLRDERDSIISREKECEDAARVLGVKDIFSLGFKALELKVTPNLEINRAIEKMVKQIKPDLSFIPFYADINLDHQVLFNSSVVGLRGYGDIFCYETVSSTDFSPIGFKPNLWETLTKWQLYKKVKAYQQYKHEVMPFPHQRCIEAVIAKAQSRGFEIGTPYAEAFYILKQIR